MTALSTTIRSVHLLTNAAWFGGSLMGAVGLNAATAQAGDRRDRAEAAGTGWQRWGTVQGAAIAGHLLSGVGILVDNKHRSLAHPPTRNAVIAKTTLTGAAVAGSALAYQQGAKLGEATHPAGDEPQAKEAELQRRMKVLQWVTPVTTGALLVLDAYLGEQQRGPAGLLDRPKQLLGLR